MILLLAACSVFQSPCEALYTEICDACPVDGYTETMCTCLEEGTLKPSDYPDGYDISADEAEYECDSTRWLLKWPGPDTEDYCRVELKLIKEYPALACDDFGYGDTTTDYSYDSSSY